MSVILPLLETAKADASLPDWAIAVRDGAADTARAMGLPSRRVEAWRYTPLKLLGEAAYAPAPTVEAAPAVPAFGPETAEIVLVNGHPVAGLAGLPDGVSATPLAAALDEAAVRTAVETAANDDAVIALNGAALGAGLVLRIADGAKIATPICLTYVLAGTGAIAAHPRTIFLVGEGAAATVIERHVAAEGGPDAALDNHVAHIQVAGGAKLSHIRLQDAAAQTVQLSHTTATVAGDAVYDAMLLSLGARLDRQSLHVALTGSGASLNLLGAYAGLGAQHHDLTAVIHHQAPDTVSRAYVKGVLDGTSKGVFQGKVAVDRIAQRTDSHQLHKALLLARTAEVDAKPELEIYADDVVCGHGATAGELEADALFYLRARGIGEAEARALLIEGFVDEVIDRMTDEAIADALRVRVHGWLETWQRGRA